MNRVFSMDLLFFMGNLVLSAKAILEKIKGA